MSQTLILLWLIQFPLFAGYTHQVSVTFNHLQVPSTQSNFPVFVCANGAASTNCDKTAHTNLSVPGLCQSGGGCEVTSASGFDIGLFSDIGCTSSLNYELESYNSTTGALILWANIPSLSSSVDTVEYLCFGNSAITTNQSTTATWQSDYLGVWHWTATSGTTLNKNDSTSNARNASNEGVNLTASYPGQIGNGYTSDTNNSPASNGYLSAPDTGLPTGTSDRTISFWATWSTSIDGYWFFYGSGSNSQGQGLLTTNSTTKLYVGFNDDVTCTVPAQTKAWHFYVLTFVSSSKLATCYMDGSSIGSATKSSWNTVLGGKLWIGNSNPAFLNAACNCSMDETRISNAVKSADWITAEYNNGNSPSTFFTLGPDTPVGGKTRHQVIAQ